MDLDSGIGSLDVPLMFDFFVRFNEFVMGVSGHELVGLCNSTN